MRCGHIDKIETYNDLLDNPLMVQAFAWIKGNPMPTPQEKPYSIVGEDVVAIVKQYTPQHPSSGKFETHHDHVDLQICFGPNDERIMTSPASQLTSREDKPEKDVTFYATPPGEIESITLEPGQFVIFDVETDAHMPEIINNFDDVVEKHITVSNLKVVIKLRKSRLSGLKL